MSFNDKSLSFSDGAVESPIHGATYLGTSKNGTVYTWSKNGWEVTPKVQTQNKLTTDEYPDTYKVRFYN